MADEIRVYRFQGDQPLAEAIDAVEAGLREAVADGVQRVLVDVRGLTGFGKPDLLARVAMVRRWVTATQGRVKVAFVSRPDIDDEERFDVVFAQGIGFDGNLFHDEADARHWLEQRPALWKGPPPAF